MRNPIFLLALAALLVVAGYSFLHPSEKAFDGLLQLAFGIFMGKFALEQPGTGGRGPGSLP